MTTLSTLTGGSCLDVCPFMGCACADADGYRYLWIFTSVSNVSGLPCASRIPSLSSPLLLFSVSHHVKFLRSNYLKEALASLFCSYYLVLSCLTSCVMPTRAQSVWKHRWFPVYTVSFHQGLIWLRGLMCAGRWGEATCCVQGLWSCHWDTRTLLQVW